MNNEQTTLIQQHCKYKIIFLGDASVGKTSLVQQIMTGTIKSTYQPTICLESAKKVIIHNGHLYKLMLWDTAGQEKFNSLIPSFIRGAHCAIIVYDVTNKNSLLNCQKWLRMLQNEKNDKNQQTCSIVLIGNKIDLERVVQYEEAFDLAVKNKMDYVEISSKTGVGVQNLMSLMIQSIDGLKNKSDKQTKSSDGETSHKIVLSRPKIKSKLKIKKNYTCCCFI